MNDGQFTGEMREILCQARTEAILLGHSEVGSEHLLLGLLVRGGSEAAWLLELCGWRGEDLRRLIGIRRGTGTGDLPLAGGLSRGARQVLQGSRAEADALGEAQISPEHLLLALLRQEDRPAVRLLAENGTSPPLMFTELVCSLESGETFRHPEERRCPMRLLEQFCRDMVAEAGQMEPVIGREAEIETVIGILCRKNKNNPALIGEPGVGKTAIVEGLAQKMAAGQVPEPLQNRRLLNLDLACVLAGTKYRGEFEERIRDLIQEVRRCGNVILFVDEMHTIVGAGSAEGAIDAANLLKPALGRGEVQLIGATTLEEYRKHIEKDAALERRFRPVQIREPDRAGTLAMLEGLRPGLERHHQLRISREALEAAVDLSCRYLPNHFLPDKAVDLLDETAARTRNRAWAGSRGEETRQKLRRELDQAVQEDRFEQAAGLRDRLQQLMHQQRGIFGRLTVEWEDVARTVAHRTGIPVGQVSRSEKEQLEKLEQQLQQEILGQQEAVREVAAAVCRGRMGLADPARPVASLLFLGPTGVGKTALCKALARQVYGSQDAMVRLDMSEYMEQHAVSRLLGAPPGYVGYGEGGELTEKVRRRPYCVVLLDEIEKAHRDALGLLLQVMEDGILTDAMGRHVDFRHAIVVMTSNLGSGSTAMEHLGFLDRGEGGENRVIRDYFTPEFLGRLDRIVEFRKLPEAVLEAIARKELRETAARADRAGASLQILDSAIRWLGIRCAGEAGGARALRRRIREEIENPVSRYLLEASGNISLQVLEQNGLLQVEPLPGTP